MLHCAKNLRDWKCLEKKKIYIYICIYIETDCARYGAFLHMKPSLWGIQDLWGIPNAPYSDTPQMHARAS